MNLAAGAVGFTGFVIVLLAIGITGYCYAEQLERQARKIFSKPNPSAKRH